MYTLIVVDMQPDFRSANGKRVRTNCRREIEKAFHIDAPIIFLEYAGYQQTLQELTEGVIEKARFTLKQSDDGSAEVERLVKKFRYPRNFKVCGINTDCCVAATVRGLTARFPMSTIDVVADACASDWYHQSGLSEMKKLDFVNIINQ